MLPVDPLWGIQNIRSSNLQPPKISKEEGPGKLLTIKVAWDDFNKGLSSGTGRSVDTMFNNQ